MSFGALEHKVVDYLILKEKYPKNFFIKYEDLINNKNKPLKKSQIYSV